jgi:uncharacterized protein with HEPN domain
VKTDQTYLLHIQDCIQQIETYTRDGREVFLQSRLIQDAVVRNFEIIGEASKRLSPALKQQHPTIPWKQVAGFRDVLIHDYIGVDIEEVWNTIVNDLPALKQTIAQMLRPFEEQP